MHVGGCAGLFERGLGGGGFEIQGFVFQKWPKIFSPHKKILNLN